MLFAQNTVMISSSKRHQCRQNCCQYNKLYFNVKNAPNPMSLKIRLWMRKDLFIKLKYESNTIILFAGIIYSMRNLLSDLNNYAW